MHFKQNKQRKAILFALCMAIVLSACGEPAPSGGDPPVSGNAVLSGDPVPDAVEGPKSAVEGMTVAFILKDSDAAFFEAACDGARRYAAEWGLTVDCMGGPEASADTQLALVSRAAESGADAICLRAAGTAGLEVKLKEAREKGICAVLWDGDAPLDGHTLTVSPGTASMLGAMLAEMGVTSLAERGVDPNGAVKYMWHCSPEDGDNQDALYLAGKDYIEEHYPAWVELDGAYWSGQDAGQASAVGGALLDEYSEAVDLILCGGATALTGQCRAAADRGLRAEDITITGFCRPSAMSAYLDAGVCTRWGLWDCGLQGAMGCYLAAWLSAGNEVRVGDIVDIPRIGSVEILPNSVLAEERETGPVNSGVVLLPERVVFTAENIADYHF